MIFKKIGNMENVEAICHYFLKSCLIPSASAFSFLAFRSASASLIFLQLPRYLVTD